MFSNEHTNRKTYLVDLKKAPFLQRMPPPSVRSRHISTVTFNALSQNTFASDETYVFRTSSGDGLGSRR